MSKIKYYYTADNKIIHNDLEANETLYSDRLFRWDSTKFNTLCKKHFGDEGQSFEGRSSTLIELFLRDYLDNQSVILCSIEQLENMATGYPYWRFEIKK